MYAQSRAPERGGDPWSYLSTAADVLRDSRYITQLIDFTRAARPACRIAQGLTRANDYPNFSFQYFPGLALSAPIRRNVSLDLSETPTVFVTFVCNECVKREALEPGGAAAIPHRSLAMNFQAKPNHTLFRCLGAYAKPSAAPAISAHAVRAGRFDCLPKRRAGPRREAAKCGATLRRIWLKIHFAKSDYAASTSKFYVKKREAASRLKPGGLLDLVTRKWKIFESAGTDNEAGPALRSIRLELGVSRVPFARKVDACSSRDGRCTLTAGRAPTWMSPVASVISISSLGDALSAPNRRREMGVHYAELLGGSQLKGTTDGWAGARPR
ncbi:hypothetical protein EVAR_7477_1 [Eumeta japonica]|uniref:Uncharacterized protein n=1 Tax=Eumeta variegata TaxID=151549 RepID=A0A4C1Y1V4_EUMVA|nr:hypothetical protein EVAR_7477_1 [Eumeta japonica]